MDLERKLAVLAGAACYDASCASSGSSRRAAPGGVGTVQRSGICHSWSDDGRCISLLKVLFSNACIHDCAYCANRRSNDIPRATFSVAELVALTLNFYERNYIEGLFLSSGVVVSPDHTMERLIRVVAELRARRFGGYIHLKAIPGASLDLVRRAGLLADRLSVNIELPSEASLRRLAPDKRKEQILTPMACIGAEWAASRAEGRRARHAPQFSPAGQSTQMIVGASPESDCQILNLSEGLYRRYRLKRVYYSAYIPVSADPRLQPAGGAADLLREHRLYQADWLVRLYGFAAAELLDEGHAWLDRELDPKTVWALRHLSFFPVDLNQASYEQLMRVPGLGARSAQRIVASRRHAVIREQDLGPLGVVMRRARFFLACRGRPLAGGRLTPEAVRRQLLAGRPRAAPAATQLVLPLAGA